MLINYLILAICVLIAAIYDVITQKIPNWLSLIVVLSGLSCSYFSAEGPSLRDSGIGLIAGFLLMLPSYIFAGMGAGDVKLMAAIGSVVGISQVLDVVLYSYIGMFVMAVFFIVMKGDLNKLLFRCKTLIYGLFAGTLAYQKPDESDAASCRLPLAPAMALSTLYVLYPALYNSGFMANLWHF